MKILMVPWWLLLFGASLSSGHYIRQAEVSQPNVYEVREGASGVSFVNPKPEKPTLREILYYHVIERARDGKPITERSFTNGHGYQFLQQESSERDLSKDEKEHDDGEYLHSEHEGQNENQELDENGEHNEDDGHYEHENDGQYEHENDGQYEHENDGQYEHENDGQYEHEQHDKNGYYDDNAEAILKELLAGYNGDEEDPESTTTQKPLTDEDVKEAYKTRSYLFDQIRQRYAVKRMAVPDTLNRRKRQADMEPIPDAPELSSDISLKDAYMQPKTYGMNLNPEGGYVWNNLNKPPTYFEVGSSNGNPNEGQNESSQSQENLPQPTAPAYPPPAQSQEYKPPTIENAYEPPASEPSDSGSAEDIYVSTNRPSAMPIEEPSSESSEPINENPEPTNENPEPISANPELINENLEPIRPNPDPTIENPEPNDSGANYPVAPVIAADESNDKPESDEGPANYPIGPEVYNPEPSYPETPAIEIPGPVQSDDKPNEAELPQRENPLNEGPAEPVQSYENPGYESSQEEPKVESSPEESSEAEKNKEMPEAPTLPPLNYDNLPSYIRDAISSTEKPASYEQTENPYTNPQSNPEDKKAMEDKMEDIFATMTPVDDIPKTYGMNLTTDGGHVWNDMVNPPVSYDIGSPGKPEQEHKEEPNQEPEVKEPETQESEETKNPNEESGEPEKEEELEEPIVKPGEPNPEQPEPHESEEAKSPIEEPAEPLKEGDTEDPTAKPDQPNPEPHESEEVKNPIEEPGEQEKEGVIEEPIADPNQEPDPVNEPEPEIPGNEDKPEKEPNQPEPLEPKPENPEPEHEDAETEETKKPEVNEEPSEGNEQEEPNKLKPEDNKKPDIMSELLKSEQFWKWLGEWTATYMELLEKHMRKIAIQEICNREKAGNQMCLLDENPEDAGDTGIIIKDGKIIIDGKEIEMTKTDNLDKDLRKGNHNQYHNKEGNGNKVHASTIYGNSVGNEHVTNVFIFTDDKAEAVDKLKPANDTEVDFDIDDRIKEENRDDSIEKSLEDVSAGEETIESDAGKEELDKEEPSKDQEDKEEFKGNSVDKGADKLVKESEDESKPDFSENTSASKEYLEK